MKESSLIRDNLQNLKDGNFCYVYKEEQVIHLIELFKKLTNNYCDIKVDKVDYYYRLTPSKRFRKK